MGKKFTVGKKTVGNTERTLFVWVICSLSCLIFSVKVMI